MIGKTIIGLIGLALGIITLTAMIFSTPVLVQSVGAAPQTDNIGCGGAVTGYIRDGDHYDYHYFYGQAGDRVTITMSRTSGNLDSMIRFYFSTYGKDDFQRLQTAGTRGGSSGAAISGFLLPRTGTYSINPRRVGGEDGTTYGGYRLVVTCNSTSSTGGPSSSCPPVVPDDVSWEGTIGASNNNSISTEKGDLWVLNASSGDRIQIEFSTWDLDHPYVALLRYKESTGGWDRLASGAKKGSPTPAPCPSGICPIPNRMPTWYIDKRVSASDCYYLYIAATADSYSQTGSYFLEFSKN